MTTRLVVATDGSALGNPGPGGWAWAAQPPGVGAPRVWAAGGLTHTTNNFAELMALAEVLRSVPAGVPLEARLDSQYVIDACTKWRFGWKRRGWKKADGTVVANVELFIAIDELLGQRDVLFVKVKAHQSGGRGDVLNEFVDRAARAAAGAVRSRSHVPAGPGWPTPQQALTLPR